MKYAFKLWSGLEETVVRAIKIMGLYQFQLTDIYNKKMSVTLNWNPIKISTTFTVRVFSILCSHILLLNTAALGTNSRNVKVLNFTSN